MVIAIDFDGTIVGQDHPYDDLDTPLQFVPGAKLALMSLKAAGHKLILWSARASRSLLEDPKLDPLVRAGVKKENRAGWKRMLPFHHARHRQMLDFVERELPEVFVAIDDGSAGKLAGVDLFIDDRALRLGRAMGGFGWYEIAGMYGEGAGK